MLWAPSCPVTGDGSWMGVEIGHLLHTKLHLSLSEQGTVGKDQAGPQGNHLKQLANSN